MYCPNCGRNCGEFKFCPDCGTQVREAVIMQSRESKELQESKESQASKAGFWWSERLAEVEPKGKTKFPIPPVGTYKSADGERLTITGDAVIFYKKTRVFGFATEVQAVPFNEVCEVQLIPPRNIKVGILSIRGAQNKYEPLPKDLSEAMFDGTSVYFNSSKYGTFSRIYVFLKQCADIVNGERK